MKNDQLAQFVSGFLQDFLVVQKGSSRHTVLSYRDSIKLFLIFSASRKKKPVTALQFSDLDAKTVNKFLEYIEEKRGNCRQTRNIRLACLRSFFRYVASRDPTTMSNCQRILAIPFKRTQSSPVKYLERKEIKAILDAIDCTAQAGLRDYTLLSLMYNTGARVDEIVRLTPQSFQLERPSHVRFRGKGAKYRLCPLWPETVKLLHCFFRQRGLDQRSNAPVFTNRQGQALTRHGVRYILNKLVAIASKNCLTLKGKRFHPHCVRHYLPFRIISCEV